MKNTVMWGLLASLRPYLACGLVGVAGVALAQDEARAKEDATAEG